MLCLQPAEGKCDELWLEEEFSGCICMASCLRPLWRKCINIVQVMKEEPQRTFYLIYLKCSEPSSVSASGAGLWVSPAVVLHYPSNFVLRREWVGWVIKGKERKKKETKKEKDKLARCCLFTVSAFRWPVLGYVLCFHVVVLMLGTAEQGCSY